MIPSTFARCRWAAVLIGVSCTLTVAPAAFAGPAKPAAADPSSAGLANDGVAAYQDGDFPRAADLLSRAFERLRVPSIGLWLARALTQCGRYLEASAVYDQVAKLSPAVGTQKIQEKAQAEAADDRAALAPRIPRARIALTGAALADVRVTVDRREEATPLQDDVLLLDPGRHVVEVRRRDDVLSQTIELQEGDAKVLSFAFKDPVPERPTTPEPLPTLEPMGPRAPSDRRWMAWTAFGVGAAGLTVGVVAGLLAESKKNQLDDAGCADRKCPPNLDGDVSTLNTLRATSTVGFVIAGAGAAVGTTLLVLQPPRARSSALSAWLGLGSAGVRGAF